MWVEIDKVLAAAIAAQKLPGESREKTVHRLLLKALAADSATQSPAVRAVRPNLTPRTAAKAVAVTASANRSVTAVELAKELSWDPKRLRRWLRYAANAGHPLLSAHEHRESWVFTGREADQLRVEALHGPWQASYNWQGVVPTTTPPIL